MSGPTSATATAPVLDRRSAASAVTRERILDEAEALFAARGLAGVSVRDIAARARLTPASLYNHFAGKQALYEAVLDRGIRPLAEMLAELSTREQSLDSAEQVIRAVMAHLSRRPHLPRLIHHEALGGGVHLARLSRDWILPLVEQGLAEMEREEGSIWDADERPLVIASWLHQIFGHFAMASLLSEAFGEDALSPEGIARQTRFLCKLARLHVLARAHPDSSNREEPPR